MSTIRISKEFTFEMAHALSSKLIKTNYQPTCENLLTDIAGRIQSEISLPLKLYSLKLRETSTSYAEWFAAENI